jgi:hypothetical protein
VQLLSATGPTERRAFLYIQVTDILSRQTKVVVTGNPLENKHSYNSTHFAAVLFVPET